MVGLSEEQKLGILVVRDSKDGGGDRIVRMKAVKE